MHKFATGLWKRDPFWASIILGGLAFGLLYLLGPTGRTTILGTIQHVGVDPVATAQALGAAFALVVLAAGGLCHFIPPLHDFGDRMLKGLGKALVILFVGVPLLSWGIQHHADLGNLWATYTSSQPGR
jgi:hypothetical protein